MKKTERFRGEWILEAFLWFARLLARLGKGLGLGDEDGEKENDNSHSPPPRNIAA